MTFKCHILYYYKLLLLLLYIMSIPSYFGKDVTKEKLVQEVSGFSGSNLTVMHKYKNKQTNKNKSIILSIVPFFPLPFCQAVEP